MDVTIRRSNSSPLPTYREAIEYIADESGDTTALELVVCKMFTVPTGNNPLLDKNGFIRLESQVVKDVGRQRQYWKGGSRCPRLRRWKPGSYQTAVFLVDSNSSEEVLLVSQLYGEGVDKVKRDSKRSRESELADDECPTAATPTASRVRAQAVANAPTAPVRAWRCSYCNVDLLTKEVWAHFDRLHRPQ